MSYVSCSYCGGLHKRGEICPSKTVIEKKVTTANTFRNSYRWRKKSEQIKKRDKFLCQCCLRNMKGTLRQYEFDDLSVHHIEPIESSSEDLRMDEYNLITLCRYHHEEAEKGAISKQVLKEIVRENIEGK